MELHYVLKYLVSDLKVFLIKKKKKKENVAKL